MDIKNCCARVKLSATHIDNSSRIYILFCFESTNKRLYTDKEAYYLMNKIHQVFSLLKEINKKSLPGCPSQSDSVQFSPDEQSVMVWHIEDADGTVYRLCINNNSIVEAH